MMSPAKDHALALFQQGRWAEADQALTACLPAMPRDMEVLRALAQLRFMAQRLPEALALMDRVVTIDPHDAAALNSKGAILTAAGRFAEAVAAFDAALTLDAALVRAHANRAVALAALGRPAEALESADAALAQDPGNPGALASRGMALLALLRPEDAVPALEQALAADPDHVAARLDLAEALFQAGATEQVAAALAPLLAARPPLRQAQWIQARSLMEQGRAEEALALFRAMAAADPSDWNVLIGQGNALTMLARHDEALDSFERAAAIRPDNAAVHNNRGNALSILGRHEEALAAFQRALDCDAAYVDAHVNRAMTLMALDRNEEAIAGFGVAMASGEAPDQAYFVRATLLLDLRRTEEGIADVLEALRRDPASAPARTLLLSGRRDLCDWRDEARLLPGLAEQVVAQPDLTNPLRLMQLVDAPAAHLAAARFMTTRAYPPAPALWRGERYRHDRIRLAYLSADLQEHAVTELAAGLFEWHDRDRFETTALALGPAPRPNDPARPRLERAFDRFLAVGDRSDNAIARLVREMEIDILVDMNGFTRGGRTSILAQRAAPVQASFLGYPATMGADYIDYIIADPVVVPQAEHAQFDECIATLPECYLPADNRRSIGVVASRAAAGLPDQGFVFAAFNGRQKIGPAIFDSWMRILAAVPDSLLWLAAAPAEAVANLRREAEARGVAGGRLVFATHAPMPLHLARQRWADLFLDTLPYNAHTTASDALWGGLPVLTTPGRAMHTRCAASLLTTLGMPEMIAPDIAAFEATAIALARDPARLAALRETLAVQRRASPAFDTERYCRHLEDAFSAMHERARRGLPPRSFAVTRRPPRAVG